MKQWIWTALVCVTLVGAGLGGFYLGRDKGLRAGVAIGKRQAGSQASQAERPLVMPLLLATDVSGEVLLSALGWMPEQLGEMDLDRFTQLLNRVPSPLHDHRQEGRTLAWSLESGEDCPVCRSQAGFARDLLAAGRTDDEARARLYRGVRFEFDTTGATTLGPDGAPVQMVWWMDYQCPYCADTYPMVTELHERYGDQLRIAILNLPLKMHVQADEAALAAYAADKQGAFGAMSDVLFEQRKKLKKHVTDDVSMEKLARQVGLDLEQYRTDYRGATDLDLLANQREQARAAGVRSVPTFFVDGHMVKLPRNADAYSTYIDRILAGDDPALAP